MTVNFLRRARKLIDTIDARFWDGNTARFWEVYPPDGRTAFVWPYQAAVGMCNAYLEARDDAEIRALLTKYLNGLDKYRAEAPPRHYDSAAEVGGDPFYDDNVWIASEFLRASECLNRPDLIADCREVMRYVYSGFDTNAGALAWKPAEPTLNACTNAPAAELSARLYLRTNNIEYLNWAKKLYAWCVDALYDKEAGCFFDHIRLDGTLDERKYPYNTGKMISAAVWLYRAADDEQYLRGAKRYARESAERFIKKEGGVCRLQPCPWFNMKLLRGYADLRAAAGEDWRGLFVEPAEQALRLARGKWGLYGNDWAAAPDRDSGYSLLEQAGFCECLCILAAIKR